MSDRAATLDRLSLTLPDWRGAISRARQRDRDPWWWMSLMWRFNAAIFTVLAVWNIFDGLMVRAMFDAFDACLAWECSRAILRRNYGLQFLLMSAYAATALTGGLLAL